MSDKEIIDKYNHAYKQIEIIAKELEDHFNPQITKALAENDVDGARKIARLIPDTVVRAFALDRITYIGK